VALSALDGGLPVVDAFGNVTQRRLGGVIGAMSRWTR
jgi:hypothetical protein